MATFRSACEIWNLAGIERIEPPSGNRRVISNRINLWMADNGANAARPGLSELICKMYICTYAHTQNILHTEILGRLSTIRWSHRADLQHMFWMCLESYAVEYSRRIRNSKCKFRSSNKLVHRMVLMINWMHWYTKHR